MAAAVMNTEQPMNLFSLLPVSSACHTQEVSFQEGEGEGMRSVSAGFLIGTDRKPGSEEGRSRRRTWVKKLA